MTPNVEEALAILHIPEPAPVTIADLPSTENDMLKERRVNSLSERNVNVHGAEVGFYGDFIRPTDIPRTFGVHCYVDGGCSSPLGKRGVNSRGCIDPRVVGGPTRKENRSLSY